MTHPYRWTGRALALAFCLALALAAPAQCPAPACTPGAASSPQAALFGMGILNVTLGSLNNTTAGTADGYRDYSCTQNTALALGATHPVSVRTNAGTNENVRIWIDYNNDGAFDPVAELFFVSNGARLHAGASRPVPAGAVAGVRLRLRVAADGTTAPLPTPCATPVYSQTEDYGVTLGPNTLPPVAAFGTNEAGACAGTFAFADQSLRGPAAWRWRFGDGTTSTAASPNHTYARPGTYAVWLRACNANGCDSVQQTLTWYAPLAVAAACTPATTAYCCGYGVTQVRFAGQTFASPDGRAGYEDYTCRRRFFVQQGQRYPLAIQTGGGANHRTQVYLDYNNNGRFTDPGELVFEDLNGQNPTGTVAIAGTGVTGVPLRLRVLADASGQAQTSCTNPQFGQAEDYSVVVAPSGCAALPAALALPALAGGGCAGQPVRLALPAPPAGANFQWETAPDSLAWAALPAATDTAYEATATAAPAYYRVRAACGGTQAVSPGRRVAPDPLRCYCPADPSQYQCDPTTRIGRVRIFNTSLDVPDAPCPAQGRTAGRVLPPFPAHQTAALQQGGLYQMEVSLGTADNVLGWLDIDRDGQFEPGEYVQFQALDSTARTVRGTLDVPTGAGLGPTGLRLRRGVRLLGGSPENSACQPPAQGETLDLQVTLVPYACPAGPPAAGRIEGPTAFCLGTVPALALRYQSPNVAVQWQTAPDNLTWTDVPNANGFTLTSARPFVDTLYVRAQVQCSNGPLAFTAPVRVRPDALLCFCQPGNRAVSYTPVRVRLGNTPLYAGPARAYPPARPTYTATLLAGIAYPVANRPWGSSNPNQFGAWNNVAGLDADGSGRFAPGELTPLRVYPFTLNGDSLATLRVPPTATPGARVRWRVYATDASLTLFPTSACNIAGVMDFVVTLAAPPSSAGPLTAGRVRGGAARTACPGQRVRLEALGYSRGATLRWEQRVGAGPWAAVATAPATAEVFVSAPLTAATAFRLRATGPGGAQAWTAPVAVALDPALCPCTANLGGYNLNSTGGRLLGTLSEVMVRGPRSFMRCRHVGAPPRANNSVYTDLSFRGDSTHTTLYRGEAGQLDTRSVAAGSIFDACDVGAWLDFNANGRFEPAEFVRCTDGTGNFTVPATAALGPVRLRVRSKLTVSTLNPAYGPNDACRAVAFNNAGETEDYTLTIADAPPCDAPDITFVGAAAVGGTVQLGTRLPLPAGLSTFWEGPGGFTSAQARPTLAGLTLAQSGYYLLTLRDASGDFELTAARYLQVGQGLATAAARPAAPALQVYPNPATGLATVRVLPAAGASYHTLQVLNGTGQVLLARPFDGRATAPTEVPLDLHGYPPGLYVVRLLGSGASALAKLVVE